jgi:hypothetical protein
MTSGIKRDLYTASTCFLFEVTKNRGAIIDPCKYYAATFNELEELQQGRLLGSTEIAVCSAGESAWPKIPVSNYLLRISLAAPNGSDFLLFSWHAFCCILQAQDDAAGKS